MPRNLKHILFSVVLIVAFAAIVELLAFLVFKTGVAVRVPKETVALPFHPYLGWESAPERTFTGTTCGGRFPWVIDTDEWGRSITPHLDHDDPEVIVVVLGGSTIFGVGATDNRTTVASLIERELGERVDAPVEVYNLAVMGYMSFQETLCLERFFARGQADVVVTISGKNDALYAAFGRGPEVGLLPDRVGSKTELVRSIERGELSALRVGLGLLVERLREVSYAIDLVGKAVERVSSRTERDPKREPVTAGDLEREQRVRRVVTNYAMADVVARHNGARYFMFLQPTAVTKETLTPEDEECVGLLEPLKRERYFAFEAAFYDGIRASEKSFEFHDITDCLDDMTEPAYFDWCHYRDVAAATIAEAVCDVIAPVVAEVAGSR